MTRLTSCPMVCLTPACTTQVGRLATCLGSPSCDIHELDMEVAGRAAADTLAGPAGAQGPSPQQQGKQHIKTDAEEVRLHLMGVQRAVNTAHQGSPYDGGGGGIRNPLPQHSVL
jgi:hypothetical protein